jgi:hypothetical protein
MRQGKLRFYSWSNRQWFWSKRSTASLPAIAQRGCDGVNRQLNALTNAFVGFTGAVAFHEFDLEQVERLDIGQAQADGIVQRRVGLKQVALARCR